MNYLDKANEMYNMVYSGQLLDAFEKFYHEDVVMVEATGASRTGKQANREYEMNFVSFLQEIHGGEVLKIASNETEGVTMVESWMEFTLKDGSRNKLEQVAVQKWKDGQIIHERFYYNA